MTLGLILVGAALSAEEKRLSVEGAAKMFGNKSLMSNVQKKAQVVEAVKGLQGAEATKAAKTNPAKARGPAGLSVRVDRFD